MFYFDLNTLFEMFKLCQSNAWYLHLWYQVETGCPGMVIAVTVDGCPVWEEGKLRCF